MSHAFALLTSDPNLYRCELHRLQQRVVLASADRAQAAGVGSYANEEILLQGFSGRLPSGPVELAPRQETEALVYHAGSVPVGASLEAATQPHRFRRWLFAHVGRAEGLDRARARVKASLPEFLQRQVQGDSDSELAFMIFLRLLRDLGRTDDRRLEAGTAGHLLGKAARMVEQFAAEAGATRNSTLNFIATNGHILLATRHGDQPLYYTLLEGAPTCEVCKLDGLRGTEAMPAVRAHLRRKTVAVATHVTDPRGWIELGPNQVLEVEHNLSIRTSRL